MIINNQIEIIKKNNQRGMSNHYKQATIRSTANFNSNNCRHEPVE